jgi:uncharacterized membrane protein YphA (DoxX/SURF4 family)
VLRIAVGAWFLKSVVTKLGVTFVGGWLPVLGATERWTGFMPGRVAEFAAGNPLGWYAAFLNDIVVTNGSLFASLTAFGEAAVGIGLTFGILTRYASLVGLALATNYLLSTFWMSPGQMGFHLLLVVAMVCFAGAEAGRTWGLDGWLAQKWGMRRRSAAAAAAGSPGS